MPGEPLNVQLLLLNVWKEIVLCIVRAGFKIQRALGTMSLSL